MPLWLKCPQNKREGMGLNPRTYLKSGHNDRSVIQYTYSKKGRDRRLSQNKCVAILVSTLADNTREVLISKKARDWGTAEVVLWHTQACPGKSTLHSLMLVKACLGGIPHKRIKCERHSGSPAARPGSSCFYFTTCLVSLWCPKSAVIDLT